MIQLTFEEVSYYNTIVDKSCCIEMRHAINSGTMIVAGNADKPYLELMIGDEIGMPKYRHPVKTCPFCEVKVTIHSSVKEAS